MVLASCSSPVKPSVTPGQVIALEDGTLTTRADQSIEIRVHRAFAAHEADGTVVARNLTVDEARRSPLAVKSVLTPNLARYRAQALLYAERMAGHGSAGCRSAASLGLVLATLGLSVGACAPSTSEQQFAVTLDYAGERSTGTMSFLVDDAKSMVDHTELGALVDGTLPVDSAISTVEGLAAHALSTSQTWYELRVRRTADDAAAFANSQPPAPFALCDVYPLDLGHATACRATIENASVTMTELP